MAAHALLSASAAERWLNCPPSARLCESYEDTKSSYAAEGSLAHEVAELTARKHFKLIKSAEVTKALKSLKKDEYWDDEMLGHAETYKDYINEIALSHKGTVPYITFEKQVNYSRFAPEGFGTADCIIIADNTLHIIDYKYGKGVPVDAERNSQLRLYALGAYDDYAMMYDIRFIRSHVVQPRLDSITTFTETIEDVLEWANSIKPIAELAFDGKGDFKAGNHCRFCRAGATCKSRAEENLEIAKYEFAQPTSLSKDDIAEILKKADNFKKWIESIEGFALDELLSGKEIPGFKIVEGRSNRKIEDTDRAFEKLIKEYKVEESLLYERKPIALTAIEKMIPKDVFKVWSTTEVIKPQGKPTVVPLEDKRQAYKLATAQKEFKD